MICSIMKILRIYFLSLAILFIFPTLHANERIVPSFLLREKPHAKDTTLKHSGLEKLPLLRFNSKDDTANYFVILFPGDGGWRDVMNTVTKGLTQRGVNVVGFNTLPYFRKKKTPSQIASDIQKVMDHYIKVWNKKYVVLGGYSFSAEMLPFAYNAMDSKYQAKILQLILLAPSHLADFKVGTLFIYPASHSTPLLPELEKINPNKMLIICDGVKESICRTMPYENPFNIVYFKCNHWFVGYKKEVAQVITEQLKELDQ
jgi:type IV secretory pathway VirJ component